MRMNGCDAPSWSILARTRYCAKLLRVPFNEAWAVVHVSNMAKLGPDGKPIYREDGKILKPEGWQPPDIGAVLDAHGVERTILQALHSASA